MKKIFRPALLILGFVLILTFQNCGDVRMHSMNQTSLPPEPISTLNGVFCHPDNAADVTPFSLSEFYALNLNVRKFKDLKDLDSDMDGTLDNLQATAPSGGNAVRVSPQDTDEDGLPDFVEILKGLNPAIDDLYSDGIDSDGVINIEEVQIGTDPSASDADQPEIIYNINQISGTTPNGCGAGQKAYEFQVSKMPLLPTGPLSDSVNTVNSSLSLSHGTDENIILLLAKMNSVDATVKPVFIAKIFRQSVTGLSNNRFNPKDFFILSDSYSPCGNCQPTNLNLTYRNIYTGFHHACAVSASNKLFCWGDNGYGQLGDDSTQRRLYPTAVQNLTEDVDVAALGSGHSCVLTKPAGNVYCWGRNLYGQLGNGTTIDSTKPVKVNLGAGVTASKLVAGSRHNCAVITTAATDPANIKCWGQDYGTTPIVIDTKGARAVTSISAAEKQVCFTDSSRDAYCWPVADPGPETPVSNYQGGPVGYYKVHPPYYHVPVENDPGHFWIVADPNKYWSQIATNGNFITAINASSQPSSKIVCWGGAGCLEKENPDSTAYNSNSVGIELVQKLAMGPSHTCALRGLLSGDNEINCWGDNTYGQTGQSLDPANTSTPSPMSVSISKPIDVAVSTNYSCGIDGDGHVWCWGMNNYGQLGTGNTINPSSPQKVLGQ